MNHVLCLQGKTGVLVYSKVMDSAFLSTKIDLRNFVPVELWLPQHWRRPWVENTLALKLGDPDRVRVSPIMDGIMRCIRIQERGRKIMLVVLRGWIRYKVVQFKCFQLFSLRPHRDYFVEGGWNWGSWRISHRWWINQLIFPSVWYYLLLENVVCLHRRDRNGIFLWWYAWVGGT